MGRTPITVDERRRMVLDARLLSFPCAKRYLAAEFGTADSSLIQEQSFHPILRPYTKTPERCRRSASGRPTYRATNHGSWVTPDTGPTDFLFRSDMAKEAQPRAERFVGDMPFVLDHAEPLVAIRTRGRSNDAFARPISSSSPWSFRCTQLAWKVRARLAEQRARGYACAFTDGDGKPLHTVPFQKDSFHSSVANGKLTEHAFREAGIV
jgi:hypothetical protein